MGGSGMRQSAHAARNTTYQERERGRRKEAAHRQKRQAGCAAVHEAPAEAPAELPAHRRRARSSERRPRRRRRGRAAPSESAGGRWGASGSAAAGSAPKGSQPTLIDPLPGAGAPRASGLRGRESSGPPGQAPPPPAHRCAETVRRAPGPAAPRQRECKEAGPGGTVGAARGPLRRRGRSYRGRARNGAA